MAAARRPAPRARALHALDRFFFAPRPIEGLVAARILLGTGLLVIYARRLPFVQLFFGPEGFGGAGYHARILDATPINPNIASGIARVLLGLDADAIAGLYILLLVAAAAFALGAGTRLAGASVLLLHLLFYARNPFVYEGSWAEFICGPLLYVTCSASGRHFSVDALVRRARGRAEPSWLAPAWPLRLFQLHVCAMYVAAAWSRLDRASWLQGELVFIALSGATHGRFPSLPWGALRPLLALGTWGALVLEVGAPVALWLPRLGRLWALGLVGLHLSLELMTNVGGWNFVMLGGALCFLLPLRRGERAVA